MPDYQLYYWPVPFRGQFVRAVLAYAGKSWSEASPESILRLMSGPVSATPVPFMGPPILIDERSGVALSQMPAIILYLGETFSLLPASPGLQALTTKIVADANDVLDEVTLNGGRQMWTPRRWGSFVPRLHKWMSIWEDTGRRHGLSAQAGFLLGGDAPGVADIVTAVLWGTMADRFEVIEKMLAETAPMTSALIRRVADLPALADLAAEALESYGGAYCGGHIERSLRAVLKA